MFEVEYATRDVYIQGGSSLWGTEFPSPLTGRLYSTSDSHGHGCQQTPEKAHSRPKAGVCSTERGRKGGTVALVFVEKGWLGS